MIENRIGDVSLSEKQFFADLRSATTAQFQECAAYRALCKRQGFDPERDLQQPGDEVKIPWVTSNSYKKSHGMFMRLLRKPPQAIEVWTASSGTSGDPSLVGRSLAEVRAYRQAYEASYLHLQGRDRWDVSLLFWVDPDPILARSEPLMNGTVQPFGLHCAYDPGQTYDPEARQFVAQFDPQTKGFSVDSEAVMAALHQADEAGKTIFVGGAAILMYGALYRYAMENAHSFRFGDRCDVQFGAGGWSGRKGSMDAGGPIPKDEFIPGLCDLLGLESTRSAYDNWGATETPFAMPAHFSDALSDFYFHELPWARIIVRDPETLEPLDRVGEQGLLEVVTPYAVDSYAGVAVLVDDILELIEVEDRQDCGFDGQLLRFVGRARGAEARGCGAMIAGMVE
jgi:hypothetical protein